MIDINKFLQLDNPDIARQTRNMSYFDALKSEIPGTKSYQGYNPFYKGADKTGLGGYLKQGVNSVQGKFTPGSNVGGATPLTRKLAQDTMRLGIGASQAGRSVLGKVLGAALGPSAAYASTLTAPNMIMASMLDGPNVRSGAADQFAGMMGEAMIPEDYAPYSDLLGTPDIPEASQALDDEYYGFDEVPSTQTTQASSPRALGAEYIPEEEKGLGELLRNLSGGAVNFGKNLAGRSIASQALGGAGGAIFGPIGALAGGIAGLFGGGDMFNSPYIGAGAATVDEYGNMYSAEQLDQMNARGGYYTDPARSSRRRDSRIRNMLERRNAGLQVGLKNLARLQEQQRQEEAARQSAADAMQDSNRAAGTGGYQSSYAQDTGFMEGPDTSKGESFSSVQGST